MLWIWWSDVFPRIRRELSTFSGECFVCRGFPAAPPRASLGDEVFVLQLCVCLRVCLCVFLLWGRMRDHWPLLGIWLKADVSLRLLPSLL